MLTYILFKTQSILLSASSRKGQPYADLHPVWNPEHALVSNKHKGPATCWLTSCSKPGACPCQQQAGRASQMLTYKLYKTKSMLLSGSEDKPKQILHLHSVYNESTVSLASSWDQLAVGLLPVKMYCSILQLDSQVSFTYHMWKIMQYILNHLSPLSLSFE